MQVNFYQKLLFLHQLTHNMMIDDNLFIECGLSAKDRGATKNPVSDLKLNLSKTAPQGDQYVLVRF